MPLTKAEFDEACREICPHCRAERPLKKRAFGPGEWQHQIDGKGTIAVSICWASGLRNGQFVPKQ